MCLAIPAKITEMKDDGLATVDILGVTRDIALDLTPQATLGDFVLVHAGFAIEVVDADYAQETPAGAARGVRTARMRRAYGRHEQAATNGRGHP